MIKINQRQKTVKAKLAEKNLHRQDDIKTALLNVMADLKETNVRDEAILASIADGVVVIDRKGLIVLINQSATKLLGWRTHETIGKKWFKIIKRQDEAGNLLPPEKGAIREALINKVTSLPSPSDSYYYVRKQGTRFSVARTVSPIINRGKVVGAINVFRDVTFRKELDQMKSEFMDIAAHDLRTPATAIRGFISLVLDGDAGKISAKAKELLNEAYNGNLRLLNLIEDFLVVSRFERGVIKLSPRANDLAEIIKDSIKELLYLAKPKGLSLSYKKVKLPLVLVDKERLFQVLNNLIGNAIKFTDKGGVTIWHQLHQTKVVTNVTDTGIGISAKLKKTLFQKYSKKQTGLHQSGLGLGLYISKICVENSGGKIWVKSQKGKGSTFSFSLPIAK